MSRPVLPPEYVKVETDWLYGHHEIKEPVKIFFMQLRGLAWGKSCTPWLSMDELEELTGKKHSVIWGYMATLRNIVRLSWRTSGDGKFMYTFTANFDNSETSDELRNFGSASSSTTNINNNNKLTDKEEERTPKLRSVPKNRSGLPTNPKEAYEHEDINVYRVACGRIPGVTQYKTVIETIALLRTKHEVADSALAELIKPYWLAWSTRKRKDGQPYNPAALTWLTEWAVNGSVPTEQGKNNISTETDTARDDFRRRVANASRGI